jgi:uncharacterized protein YidB (DUF937 family)
MGLLDSVLGAALGGGQQGGGGQADLLKMVVGMLAGGSGAQAGGAGGGLGGLIEQFQRSGMGDVVGSWVSTGENMPISPDQLGQVLGGDQISGMASKLGMDQGDLLGQLSQMLPQVVDKLTPNGQVPAQVDAGGLDLGGLLGALLKR